VVWTAASIAPDDRAYSIYGGEGQRAVASWKDFSEQEAEIAELAARILSKYGIAYLATLRGNGWPRLHPISPAIVDGKFIIGIILGTPKLRDLDRDGRCVVHALPGPNDAEICISGVAGKLISDEVERLAKSAPPNVRIGGSTAVFEIDVQQVNYTTYQPGPDSLPVPTKKRWTALGSS
jgi:hypothetical protein